MKEKERLFWRTAPIAVLMALVLAGCTSSIPLVEPESEWDAGIDVRGAVQRESAFFVEQEWSRVPGSGSRDWRAALDAFRKSCARIRSSSVFNVACSRLPQTDDVDAQAWFREVFTPWRVLERSADSAKPAGLMTGYYEPMLEGRREQDRDTYVPLYGVPDDLLTIDIASVYPKLKGMRLRGRVQGNRVVPYFSRGEIDKKGLPQKNVLCYVKDPVEAFFLQIQGSGRVRLEDGSFLRLGYADQNGHPYKAIGSWLIENAGLRREEMSMQRIKEWARNNPDRVAEMLSQNPSYVFFKPLTELADSDGPYGAQGVSLTPQASVAVDRRFWPMGTPFVVHAYQGNPAMEFSRPVIAQDTGGAIRGVIRFDYFWGYGAAAGASAGRQKSRARAWVLLPKGISPAEIR